MKTKPFIRVCESDVLRRSVVVCCGSREQVRKLMLDPKTFQGLGLSQSVLNDTWRTVAQTWDAACNDAGGALGFTMHYKGDVFIVLPKWDSRVFIHEAYHAAQAVLRLVGATEDEELGAFLVEWLFEKICWCGCPGGKRGRK